MKTKPVTISPATYARLQKFATKGGSIDNIATVIGSEEENVIQAYLGHMKAADPKLHKTWGSKYEPDKQDDDDFDITAEPDDDDFDVTAEATPPAAPPVRQNAKVQISVDKNGDGISLVPGVSTAIPEKFRLRGANGLDTPLEVFSRSPKFGYILEVPVPKDMRTIHIKGTPVQIDLLALRREPDGMTDVAGRKVSNSKLIAAAELED